MSYAKNATLPYSYAFHTDPFEHQRVTFDLIKDDESNAIFWEQGTGKSKLVIDKACYLYETDQIDAVIVVGPNGVHRNWITDELPVHCPPRILKDARIGFYQSNKIKTKRHSSMIDAIIAHKDGMIWLAMSYDAFVTETGKKYGARLLKSKRCLFVIDEATRIKTPKAERTRTILTAAKFAKYKMMLTGTPVANGPLDMYSLMRFIDPDFWKPHQLGTYTAFKQYFGIWRKGINQQSGRQFEILVDYQNVDELYEIIQPVSSRVLKEDVLDLPPKLYSKRYVQLTPEQEKMYKELKDEFLLWLQNGELVTAPLAIVRMLRLQQITCGYIPWDTAQDGQVHLISDKNPRLDVLSEICTDLPHKAIIWARFRKDIDLICEMLGNTCVRYDGSTSDDDRAIAKDLFQNGGAGSPQYFVANPAAAGEGLTLHAAKTVIYYNNSFKLQDRLQSEDRAHRIGQDQSVHYIDLIADNTIDSLIVDALKKKKRISALILGDEMRDWL